MRISIASDCDFSLRIPSENPTLSAEFPFDLTLAMKIAAIVILNGDVRTKKCVFLRRWWEKLFDPWASGRKGQECPPEIRTEKFMFMPFFFFPDIGGAKRIMRFCRDRRNHDSQRRDRIPRFFLRPEIGQFSPDLGAISLLNYTENLEKEEKIHWRKFR